MLMNGPFLYYFMLRYMVSLNYKKKLNVEGSKLQRDRRTFKMLMIPKSMILNTLLSFSDVEEYCHEILLNGPFLYYFMLRYMVSLNYKKILNAEGSKLQRDRRTFKMLMIPKSMILNTLLSFSDVEEYCRKLAGDDVANEEL